MKPLCFSFVLLMLLVSMAAAQGFPNPGPGIPAATAAADVTPPAVPIGVSVLVYAGPSAQVIWSHTVPGDVDHTLVRYRCPSGSGGYTVVSVLTPTTFAAITGLTAGVNCDFAAAAVDAAGNTSAYTTDLVVAMGATPSFPVASGSELLCGLLGTNCICSEPLNGPEGGVEIGAVNYNFASSDSTYGCSRNPGAATFSPAGGVGHYPIMEATTVFGSSGYALRAGGGRGDFFFHGRRIDNTGVLSSSDTQLCWRIYKWVTSDYGNTGGCSDQLSGPSTPQTLPGNDGLCDDDRQAMRGDCMAGSTWRNKMFQVNFANQPQAFQAEEQNYSGAVCHTGGPYGNLDGGNDVEPPGGGWSGVLNLSPPVDWNAAKIKPMRMEYCVESRDAGGVRGGNRIVVRTRVKNLVTGVISTSVTPETTGWGTINGYDYSGVDADHTGPGYNLYGFFIQTKSQASPDSSRHWPGCAQEVEGTVECPLPGGD